MQRIAGGTLLFKFQFRIICDFKNLYSLILASPPQNVLLPSAFSRVNGRPEGLCMSRIAGGPFVFEQIKAQKSRFTILIHLWSNMALYCVSSLSFDNPNPNPASPIPIKVSPVPIEVSPPRSRLPTFMRSGGSNGSHLKHTFVDCRSLLLLPLFW